MQTQTAVQDAMGRPTKDTVQITLRVPTAWLTRADTIAAWLVAMYPDAGRTHAFRAAMAKGFDALEAELGPADKSPAGAAKRIPRKGIGPVPRGGIGRTVRKPKS